MPKVIFAKHMGFCFGVRKAVSGALSLAKQFHTVYTVGELIHNTYVVNELKEQGIIPVNALSEIPDGAHAVIRSHGVPPSTYHYFDSHHITYTDLTCPFVTRIHERVHRAKDSYDIIVIVGKASHPEVVGIKGWAAEKGIVVNAASELPPLSFAKSALVVAQTTILRDQLLEVFQAVKEKIPSAELFDSICKTTSERQKEAASLAQKSDAVIVVGDRKSSNTDKLAKIAYQYCKNIKYIEHINELSLENYIEYDIISIVAGASTPDRIIMEVKTQMSELENVQATENETQEAMNQAPESTIEPANQDLAAQEAAPVAEDEEKKEDQTDFLAELEKTFKKIRKGQFITGVVVQVSEDEVCVNIGYKSDGIIKKDDLMIEEGKTLPELFQPGDEIKAEVITLNDGEGNVRLSRKKVETQLRWKTFVDELDQEKIYSCKVSKAIKGGVLSKLEGYDAFIPASQLSLKYVEDLNTFVGQTLEVKIIDVDKRQKRFVLSAKDVLKMQAEEEEKKRFASFEKGTLVTGTVKRLTDFGAFVDIGGVDGLLHITDISWARINHPKDVLSEGQEIEVKIINVDPEKKKISLGYKQLQPKPWDLAPEKYHADDIVTGKVVRIAPFGAFVELEPMIDGLVHISQVANKRIEKVEDVLTLGQEVTAKVLEVNPEKKRISLSIRALIEEPKKEEAEEPAEQNERPSKRERSNKEDFSFTIPPVEEATTSLADFFPKMDDAE